MSVHVSVATSRSRKQGLEEDLEDQPFLRMADGKEWLQLFGLIDFHLLFNGLGPVTPLHHDRRVLAAHGVEHNDHAAVDRLLVKRFFMEEFFAALREEDHCMMAEVEVEGSTGGADRLSIEEDETRIRVPLGIAGDRHKLPFSDYLAILFKVHRMSLLRLHSALLRGVLV
jgi:hypothetical protein